MTVDPAKQDAAQRSEFKQHPTPIPPSTDHRIAQRSLYTLLQIPEAAPTPPRAAAPRYSEGESCRAIALSAST